MRCLCFMMCFSLRIQGRRFPYTVANGETVKPEEALAEVEEIVREAARAPVIEQSFVSLLCRGIKPQMGACLLTCDEIDSMADPKQAHAVSGNDYADSENRGDELAEEVPASHLFTVTPDFTHEDYKGAPSTG